MMRWTILAEMLLVCHLPGFGQKTVSTIIVEQEVSIESGMVTSGNASGKNTISFSIHAGKARSHSEQMGAVFTTLYLDSIKTLFQFVKWGAQTQKTETPDFLEKERGQFDKIDVKEVEEEKWIANRKCKKAILLLTKAGVLTESVVWYDPEIVLPFSFGFNVVGLELIKGLPMEYQSTVMGFTMIHKVTRVDLQTPIPNETFVMPN